MQFIGQLVHHLGLSEPAEHRSVPVGRRGDPACFGIPRGSCRPSGTLDVGSAKQDWHLRLASGSRA